MSARRSGKVLLLAAAFAQGGCTYSLLPYSIGLERLWRDGVIVPTDSMMHGGPDGSALYIDSAFTFTVSETIGLCLRLTNRLDRPMIVHYGDTQFVDSAGQLQAIVAPGGPAMPRNSFWGKPSTPDQTLAPGESLSEFIIPATAVREARSWSNCGWEFANWFAPLFPIVSNGKRATVEVEARKQLHRRFSVITPISIDGRIRLYRFDLVVSGFRLGGGDL